MLDFCSIHLFADDVQIYIRANNNSELPIIGNRLNHLRKVMSWSHRNLLPINPSKTKAMLITKQKVPPSPPPIYIDSVDVTFVNRVNDLGVIFKDNLEWDAHINSQCAKIYGSLKRLTLTT